ncbi:hypothetical protein Tco_0870367 [Tanacetum coccineum]
MNTTQFDPFAGANSSNKAPKIKTGDRCSKWVIFSRPTKDEKESQACSRLLQYIKKNLLFTPRQFFFVTWKTSSGHPLPPNQSAPGTGMNNAASSSEIDNSTTQKQSCKQQKIFVVENKRSIHLSAAIHSSKGLSPNPRIMGKPNSAVPCHSLEHQKRIIQIRLSFARSASTDTKARNRENLSCRKQHQHQQLGDSKGKAVSSSSLLVSGSDQNQHGVVDNRDDVNTPPL